MKRRGVTLLELLVAAILAVSVVAGLAMAFQVAVHHEIGFDRPRQQYEAVTDFQTKLRSLLSRAYISSNVNDLVTVFKSMQDSQIAGSADRLTWTAIGLKPSGAALDLDETDFDQRNKDVGPIGGITEVSVSTTPIGTGAGNLQGLFIRTQTPADEDHDYGGYEQLLTDQVQSIMFEFLDGGNWVTTWDSDTDRRLPTAVRVTYTLTSDTSTSRSFIVRLVNSNPDQQQGAQQ